MRAGAVIRFSLPSAAFFVELYCREDDFDDDCDPGEDDHDRVCSFCAAEEGGEGEEDEGCRDDVDGHGEQCFGLALSCEDDDDDDAEEEDECTVESACRFDAGECGSCEEEYAADEAQEADEAVEEDEPEVRGGEGVW